MCLYNKRSQRLLQLFLFSWLVVCTEACVKCLTAGVNNVDLDARDSIVFGAGNNVGACGRTFVGGSHNEVKCSSNDIHAGPAHSIAILAADFSKILQPKGNNGNQVILNGNSNTIDMPGRANSGNVIGTGAHNRIDGVSGRSVIMGGTRNRITASERAFIGSGFYNRVVSDRLLQELENYEDNGGNFIATGQFNEILFGSSSFLGGGNNNSISRSSSSSILSGQFNLVNASSAHAIGSFAQVVHDNAIVLSAVINPIGPSLYCSSTGIGTVTVCAENGVFIQGVDIVQELAAEKERVANLTDEVATLREELNRTTMEEVASLEEKLQRLADSIRGECIENPHGRRILTEEPCFTFFPTTTPTSSPIASWEATPVGRTLVDDRDKPNGEDWEDEELRKLFEEGIKEFNEACALREDLLDAIFANSPASRQGAFRRIFPACPPPSPTPEPTPEPPLTAPEIAGIVAAGAAVAGVVVGVVCGNSKFQESCARKCKACAKKKGKESRERAENAGDSEPNSPFLSQNPKGSKTLTEA